MSNKEIEDLKTLLKSLEIRLRNEEITKGEYEDLKAKYEAKLEEELSLLREKSFLKDISYISISGSGKVTNSYISISGSGRVEGWKGGTISISGSGKVSDDEIKVSGSATLPGDLETHTLIASGSLNAEGPIKTNIFTCSGSCKINGYLVAHEKLEISGAGKIESDIKGGIVNSSGALKVNGSILCVEAEISGAYKIEGNVECQESFYSELSGKSRIKGDLTCGGDVKIEQEKRGGQLEVNNILAEGDIYLEGVIANIVRGKQVEIGPNCNIKEIEERI